MCEVWFINYPNLVIPSVQFAIAPSSDQLFDSVPIQVVAADLKNEIWNKKNTDTFKRGLPWDTGRGILGLDPPPSGRFLVHPNRSIGQSVTETAVWK